MGALTRPGLTAVVDGIRPCARWDPRMWETGDPGNVEAISICGWCPFRGKCPDDNPNPIGVVVAGTAYDDWGQPLSNCGACGEPLRRSGGTVSGKTCPQCNPVRPGDHHALILELRAAEVPFPVIAERIGVTVAALKDHWRRNQHKQPPPAKPVLTPLPPVNGKGHAPTDHHDLVAEMTIDPQFTAADVAYVLGCTSGTVRSYWRRYGRPRWEREQAAKQSEVAA